MKDGKLRAIEFGFVTILLCILILLLSGCASAPDQRSLIEDAEWSCSNTELADYEYRDRDVSIKVRCKE